MQCCLRLLVLLWVTTVACWNRCAGASEHGEAAGADPKFAAALAVLAEQAQQQGLTDEAQLARSWIVPRDAYRQVYFLGTAADGADSQSQTELSPAARQWYDAFMSLRRSRAEYLWQQADSHATRGDYESAYRLLHEIVREDPGHPEALRRLGTKPSRRLDVVREVAGRSRHAQYGWAPGAYWTIESRHFRVSTSAGAEAGRQLAEQLEILATVWRQVFLHYWVPEGAFERAWKTSKPLGRPTRKHQVVLFANRQEYLNYLRRFEPQIDKSLGVYRDVQRTAFYYAGEDSSLQQTWMHEATHQLFHEVVPVARHVAGARDFWMVEAVALYMESLVPLGDYCTVGGWEADRLQYARYRARMEGFYVPLSVLIPMGRVEFQQHPELRRIYSQAAGLAHFLMDGQHGTYRRATVEYLRDIYQSRPGPSNDWEQRMGASAEAMDQQYREFLDVTDQALSSVPAPERIRNLSLGRTQVTDAGLQVLARCNNLEWLDVSLCDVSDIGLSYLHPDAPLRHVSAAGTQITDAALGRIAGYDQLQELDLSGTKITDEGLVFVAQLEQLQALWLAGTAVTDKGLSLLHGLKNLELLHLAGSRVTDAGRQQLQEALPQVAVE